MRAVVCCHGGQLKHFILQLAVLPREFVDGAHVDLVQLLKIVLRVAVRSSTSKGRLLLVLLQLFLEVGLLLLELFDLGDAKLPPCLSSASPWSCSTPS